MKDDLQLFKWLTEDATASEIEAFADARLRHKDVGSHEYLKHWLKCLRPFAYATNDDSWGEMEKLFAIVYREYVLAKRRELKE